MAATFVPQVHEDTDVSTAEPVEVVEAFLAAFAADDLKTAATLLDEQVTYINVGLPTIRGRRATIGVLKPMSRPGVRFEVYLHGIAADGQTVLTDRTDVLVFGPVRLQFWVTGRFEVQDGLITLWRDSFDYVDITRALIRGLLGAVVPALRPAAPRSPDDQPGRH